MASPQGFTLKYKPTPQFVSMKVSQKITYLELSQTAFAFLPNNYDTTDKEIVAVRKSQDKKRFVIRFPLGDKSENDPIYPIFKNGDRIFLLLPSKNFLFQDSHRKYVQISDFELEEVFVPN